MPFQSEKQRRYLHANHPEIAKRWERDYGEGGIAALNTTQSTSRILFTCCPRQEELDSIEVL